MGRKFRWTVIPIAVLLSACQSRLVNEQAARIAELEKKNTVLQEAIEARTRELQAVREQAGHGRVEVPEARPAPPPVNPEQLPVVQDLRASVVQANTNIAALQEQVAVLQERIRNEAGEQKRLDESFAETRRKLEVAEKNMDAASEELKKKDGRINQLLVMNQRIQKESDAQKVRIAELGKLVGQLKDLERRREDTAGNLHSRYREATDQYRALAAAIEGQQQTGTGVSRSLDLSRIQQTISSAEEDLRQLRTLNSQAARVQSEILDKIK